MNDKPLDTEDLVEDLEDFNKQLMAKVKTYNELNELATHKMQFARYTAYANTYNNPLIKFKEYLYLVDDLGDFNKHHLYVIQEYLEHPSISLEELFQELAVKHHTHSLSDTEYYTNQLEMFGILTKDADTGHTNIDLHLSEDGVNTFYEKYMARLNSYQYDPSQLNELYEEKYKYRE